MYCAYFGFSEKPFNITPDPAFIYFSRTHQEAFAHLLYGIDNHVGFMEITGEVGTGKTTVLRTLLSQLDGKNYRTALIFNPCLSSTGLMQSINREFGIPYKDLGNEELLDELNQFLLRQNAEGNTVVLVIDEAQNLKRDVLEQVRLISNLETVRDKLIQIVLAGQPELVDILASFELRQLNQRIAVRYNLCRMDFEETKDYIRHRLAVAGGRESVRFSDGAFKRIFRFSGGLPRLINIICDRTMLAAYSGEQRVISTRIAAIAAKDIGITHQVRRRQSLVLRVCIVVSAVAIVAAVSIIFQKRTESANPGNLAGNIIKTLKIPNRTTKKSPDALRDAISGITESASTVQAFNALASQWGAQPFPVSQTRGKNVKLESIASARSLQISRIKGDLGALVRLNSPAILELSLPGVSGNRYIAVTGADADRLRISPPVAGRNWITHAELAGIWSGQSYLIWKNFMNIPFRLKPGTTGEEVGRLQSLLRDAGVYRSSISNVYDRATITAVENFQSSHGIEVDGMAGKHTLMLLYRSAGGYFPPELTKKGGSKRG